MTSLSSAAAYKSDGACKSVYTPTLNHSDSSKSFKVSSEKLLSLANSYSPDVNMEQSNIFDGKSRSESRKYSFYGDETQSCFGVLADLAKHHL